MRRRRRTPLLLSATEIVDDGSPLSPEMESALRRVEAEHRLGQTEIETAVEEAERAGWTIEEAVLDHLYRGDRVRIAVGGRSWSGRLVHVGSNILVLEVPSGSRVDVALDHLSTLRVEAVNEYGSRGIEARDPQTFLARLRELAATETFAELGGDGFDPVGMTVTVVAPDHLSGVDRDGRRCLVSLRRVGYVISEGGFSAQPDFG